MRPVIKDKIAIFYIQGFIDGNNAPSLITLQDITYTIGLDVDAVLISFEKVIFFNKKGLDFLAEVLKQFKSKMGVLIGIFGYSKKSYDSILASYPDELPFCLFDDLKTATLFVGISEVPRDSIILFYSKDKDQKNYISLELYNRGYQAIYVSTPNELALKRAARVQNPSLFAHSFEMTHLINHSHKIAKQLFGKVVVYTLSGYIDGDVADRFDLNYHTKSLNVGFKLFVLDCERVKAMNIHGVNFIAKLSIAAAEWGATICLTSLDDDKIQPKLKEELETSGVLFYPTLEILLNDKSLLETHGGGATVNKKSKQKISKNLIEQLPVFINSTIKSLSILTNKTPIKESLQMSQLTINSQLDNLLASSIGFYGDLDGLIVLVFPKTIAIKACKILLNNQESFSDKELEDALAEFVNIVAGTTKSALSDKGIKITITLPRTFLKLNELLHTVEAKNGVQVVMSFDGEPFYFFLTR